MSRIPHILRIVAVALSLLLSAASAAPQNRLGNVNKRLDSLNDKKVETQTWNGRTNNSELMNKSFPMEKWDKHFTSLGSKKSPIDVKESKDKEIFKTKTKSYETKEFEMSQWNERMKDLEKEARLVSEPDTGSLKKATNEKLYSMLLQDTTQEYEEIAEELSLRDINKFQFRRNHSDSEVPVEKAGRR